MPEVVISDAYSALRCPRGQGLFPARADLMSDVMAVVFPR